MRSVFGAFVVVVITMLVASLLVLVSYFPRSRKMQTIFIRWWTDSILWGFNIRLKVTGADRFDPNVPSLVMSNHGSLIDIPVVYSVTQCLVRMVAKKELFKIPFLGFGMRACEVVPIDRGNRQSGTQARNAIAERIQSGMSVWLSPEGTRTRTGELGHFKIGSFAVASNYGIPIQPIVIHGAFEVQPPGRWLPRSDVILDVEILPRVEADAIRGVDPAVLANQVRESMLAHIQSK
jgi:1-acyl-sn-glycerol-3-phosphate acyltransferase